MTANLARSVHPIFSNRTIAQMLQFIGPMIGAEKTAGRFSSGAPHVDSPTALRPVHFRCRNRYPGSLPQHCARPSSALPHIADALSDSNTHRHRRNRANRLTPTIDFPDVFSREGHWFHFPGGDWFQLCFHRGQAQRDRLTRQLFAGRREYPCADTYERVPDPEPTGKPRRLRRDPQFQPCATAPGSTPTASSNSTSRASSRRPSLPTWNASRPRLKRYLTGLRDRLKQAARDRGLELGESEKSDDDS